MEAQVVRLSEAFNRQVEERDDLQSHLEAAEMKARQMVEKGVARSWVVNFVPNPNPTLTLTPNHDPDPDPDPEP